MKNAFKAFRDKYKLTQISSQKKVQPDEEAIKLALELDAVFVGGPMQEPFDGDWNKVKLPQEHINIIKNILNTSNELITHSEFYNQIVEISQYIIENNEKGITIDYIVSKSSIVKKFYYSLQSQEYWMEK